MIEKKYRSIIKTVSWRLIGTLDTVFISWLITGEIAFALSIGGIELFTKMILFYLHERTWNKISFGRVKSNALDYQI